MTVPRYRPRPLALWALCLATLGCGPCGFQPDPGIKVVVPALPNTLDWSTSDPTSWVNYPVMLATQKGLTALDPRTYQVGPGVAERWEERLTSEGHQVFTFHLRQDLRWSDGAPLTAHDFVLGWKRAAVGRERAELAELLGAPEVMVQVDAGAPPAKLAAALERLGVRALDEATFEVTLDQPRNYFLARLANVYLFFPVPSADLRGRTAEGIREYFDRPRGGTPPSLGPFRVEAWDRAGERLRLVHNPLSAFTPALQVGERHPAVVTLLKSEVGPALYERGRVDFVFIDSVVALRGPLPPDLHREQLLSTYFLAFNTERPPLNRPEVRRALSMALDREALLAGLLPAARPTGVLLPANLPGAATAEEAARLPHFDRTRAREILQSSGGIHRTLRLVYRASESFVPEVAIAERIKAQLARVGVQVEIEPRSDFQAEIDRIAPDGFHAPDLHLKRIGADYAHPKTFFVMFERGGAHATGWESADGGRAIGRFQALLARADAQEDLSAARPLYAKAQEVLVGEQAVIAPLYHPDRYFRVRPRLRGLTVDPFNFLSLSALRVEPRAEEGR